MHKLEWNEGMSVGVEAIDNDHKILLFLISRLSDAIEYEKPEDIIESIFDELGDYITIHFTREEELMRLCGYEEFDDHTKQHRKFSDKVPQLKKRLLKSNSTEVALEINLFLYQWLINHILVEDMSYAQKVYEQGFADTGYKKKTFVDRLIYSISNQLSLGWRIFLAILIPTLVVAISLWTGNATYTAAILFFALSFTLILSMLLHRSILFPVNKITWAMNELAKGRRDMRFTQKFGNDELGQMVDAYEQCRRALLQADVTAAVRFRRKDINLLHEIREKDNYEELASIDPLTGALNRRKFDELVHREIDKTRRYNRHASVMMLDIDYFKKVNDTYGHGNGDIVLQEFYQTCFQIARDTDIVARIGGEEFVIFMPETNLSQASNLANRICASIRELSIAFEDNVIQITVSIGVTEWDKTKFEGTVDMLQQADHALYEAKHTGRNRVVIE